MNNATDEAEREVERAQETIAMAERVIEISRKEHERLSSSLSTAEAELAVPAAPPVETP